MWQKGKRGKGKRVNAYGANDEWDAWDYSYLYFAASRSVAPVAEDPPPKSQKEVGATKTEADSDAYLERPMAPISKTHVEKRSGQVGAAVDHSGWTLVALAAPVEESNADDS